MSTTIECTSTIEIVHPHALEQNNNSYPRTMKLTKKSPTKELKSHNSYKLTDHVWFTYQDTKCRKGLISELKSHNKLKVNKPCTITHQDSRHRKGLISLLTSSAIEARPQAIDDANDTGN